MKIYNYLPGTKVCENTAIALGFFDGVHKGHRKLLSTAKNIAEAKKLTFAVFTFTAENSFKKNGVLYSTEEKLELLKETGVDAVILADFADISEMSAEKFVTDALLSDMGCRFAVSGSDFRFGKGASGDAATLRRLLLENGAEFIEESEHKINGEKISTSKIKELLHQGNAEYAREFLGFPYFIRCKVQHGNGVGKKLGFPTVNTEFPDNRAILKRGVYRTAVDISGKLYTGVTNVGYCPTFTERAMHAETYIVNYSGDLYGQTVRIFFLGYLREERKFPDAKSLTEQINTDKNKAINENGELTWQEIGQS